MGYRSGEAWNDEDMALLRKMYAAGASYAQIADVLERTKEAVVGKLAILKRRERHFRR